MKVGESGVRQGAGAVVNNGALRLDNSARPAPRLLSAGGQITPSVRGGQGWS